MRGGIAEIEIDSAAYDVVHDDVFPRRPKPQRSLIFVDMAGVLKFFQITLVKFCAFTLQIRPELAADMRTFIPIQAQPFQSFVDGGRRFLGVALHIGVFDTQHEFSTVMPREQPVEKRGARSADVQITGRRGGETNADFRHWSDGVVE
ncbi:MAG: hypothetical protein Udaeo_04770 [Candidatus Udaeobacter sp.]|nr:MAG: hypothetical protein Udaeo_04770 [Candidatus Udaeobacter sp.]